MKLKEIKNKYIYVFMMDGSIHEIFKRGKDIKTIGLTLEKKGGVFIPEIESYINSVSISQILTCEQYLHWINQKRPKTYLLNGKIKMLARDEIAGSKILKAIKAEELKDYKKKAIEEKLKINE